MFLRPIFGSTTDPNERSRLLKENTQLPLEIKAIFRRVGRAARPVARLTREVGSKALDYPSP
jgi:hypothetical protein